jgi:hypothetical protein
LQTLVLGLKVIELNTSLSIRAAAREIVGYILLGFGAILERTWCFKNFFWDYSLDSYPCRYNPNCNLKERQHNIIKTMLF